jgi:hypothetical protein
MALAEWDCWSIKKHFVIEVNCYVTREKMRGDMEVNSNL